MTRLEPRAEGLTRIHHIEHPMFVPFGHGQLATILTAPEGSPRGLVVMLQGLGASRSHKNRVWTRTARALANRRIASLRMDYPSMGDSIGTLHAGLDDPPVDEVRAAASLAMDLLGVDHMGIIGNCMGLRTGFTLAHEDERCLSVASILLGSAKPLLRGQGLSATGRAVKKAGKRLPKAKRALRAILPDTHLKQAARLLPEVEEVVRTRGGYFLFFGDPAVTERFRRALPGSPTGDAGAPPPAIEVRSVAIKGTSGFRIPVALQDVLIDSVVNWMDRVFPAAGSPIGDRSSDTVREEVPDG